MLFREIPFLRLFVPLCAGVIVADIVPRYEIIAVAVAAAALAVMILRAGIKSFLPDRLFGLALGLFLFSGGYLLYKISLERAGYMEERQQTVSVRLSEYPRRRTDYYSFRARIINSDNADSGSSPGGSMLLYFMSDTVPSAWQPGDILELHLSPLVIKNNGNPCEFNYRRYLLGRGIRYMGFLRTGDIGIHIPASRLTMTERSARVSHKMISLFAGAGLHDEALGLVTALTLGDKELLDRDHLDAFSRAGAMHVMAVSGLHVGMISMVLSGMLFFLRGRMKKFRAIIIIPLLWCFAFITGLSPSVMRATIMFTFLQAGSAIHRPASALNSLLASAFILTVARPAVIFEAGFQLSYLAVSFILIFYQRFSSLTKPRNWIIRYLWQVTALSLVAQAGTLPLTVRLFNIFPLFFLLTNIMIIPLTFIILLTAMLLILFSPVPAISSLLVFVLDRLARLALGFTTAIGSFDYAVLGNIGMTAAETIVLTVAIALLLTTFLRIGKITLRPFLAAAIFFFGINTAKITVEAGRQRTVSYNLNNSEYLARQHGRMLLLRPREGTIPAAVRKHAATRGLKIEIIGSG